MITSRAFRIRSIVLYTLRPMTNRLTATIAHDHTNGSPIPTIQPSASPAPLIM